MFYKLLLLGITLSTYSFAICNQLEPDSGLKPEGFKRQINRALSWFTTHHTASDVITTPGHDTPLQAQFMYGALHKGLEYEDVEILIDTCESNLVTLGKVTSNDEGMVQINLNSSKLPQKGAYRVWMRVVGDNSSTTFTLRVLEPKTKLAIFDFDGTLTFSNLNSNARAGASELTHALNNKNLEIVYLSGRHYFLSGWTRRLIQQHDLAEGSLVVGQSIYDVLPIEASVGEFKADYLEYLKSLGLELERAYGNTTSDLFAYQKAGIPQTRIFTVGEVPIDSSSNYIGADFLEHLSALNARPDNSLAN